MKIRKEFIIGIVAILTLFAAYWGLAFLKGNNLFAKEREFVLVYDKVVGLSMSNPVTVNGLQVGKVSYVDFMENDVRWHYGSIDSELKKKALASIDSMYAGLV